MLAVPPTDVPQHAVASSSAEPGSSASTTSSWSLYRVKGSPTGHGSARPNHWVCERSGWTNVMPRLRRRIAVGGGNPSAARHGAVQGTGSSAEIVGKALAETRRDDIVLATTVHQRVGDGTGGEACRTRR